MAVHKHRYTHTFRPIIRIADRVVSNLHLMLELSIGDNPVITQFTLRSLVTKAHDSSAYDQQKLSSVGSPHHLGRLR